MYNHCGINGLVKPQYRTNYHPATDRYCIVASYTVIISFQEGYKLREIFTADFNLKVLTDCKCVLLQKSIATDIFNNNKKGKVW